MKEIIELKEYDSYEEYLNDLVDYLINKISCEAERAKETE